LGLGSPGAARHARLLIVEECGSYKLLTV
jgi:hypothetical protein